MFPDIAVPFVSLRAIFWQMSWLKAKSCSLEIHLQAPILVILMILKTRLERPLERIYDEESME